MSVDSEPQKLNERATSELWCPSLIAITDARRFGVQRTLDAATQLCSLARARSVVVQLREAELSFDVALRLGQGLLAICRAADQALCINDRIDLALALGTQRVHLKPSSATADAVRCVLTARFGVAWLTRGWHPLDEALPVGVDAVLASPALASRKGRPALGVAQLGLAVNAAAPLPVFALGGIESVNAASLRELSLAGIAVQAAWYVEPGSLVAACGLARSSHT